MGRYALHLNALLVTIIIIQSTCRLLLSTYTIVLITIIIIIIIIISARVDEAVLLTGCYNNPRTLEQFACEGKELYISCGQSVIHVLDANYGRLDNSVCADQLGTPNDNCRQDATCVARKWFAFITSC